MATRDSSAGKVFHGGFVVLLVASTMPSRKISRSEGRPKELGYAELGSLHSNNLGVAIHGRTHR